MTTLARVSAVVTLVLAAGAFEELIRYVDI
jgi:hypothetical protein